MNVYFHLRTFLRGCALAAAIGALSLGMSSIAAAQSDPSEANGNDITRPELAHFNRFLETHPALAAQLRQNPNLINDPQFVAQHPGLQRFLKTFPETAEELKENPQQFMNRERRFERSGGDLTAAEVRSFDQFLDRHPELNEALRKNPSLVNDPQFMASHPELKEFLATHPQIRDEMSENPKLFMARERQFDRREANAQRQARTRPRRNR